MDAERILAHRLARSGLARRTAGSLAEAAACPASDFARDAALLALAARCEDVERDAFDAAVDDGRLVMAHVMRGAIHALAPDDHAQFGRALLARDDDELAVQLGQQVRQIVARHHLAATDALAEVADATKDALRGGRALTKDELHEALRARVRPELMPWCKGCGSHHVAPLLWRFAAVKAGSRLDARRRHRLGRPGRTPSAAGALRRYLRWYGPGTPREFAEWAGLARPHAERIWAQVEDELDPVDGAWLPREDAAALASPSQAAGVRLLPAGDPYLARPNRRLLAPDEALRKRLFRPVASPGAVLRDGRLAGLWRVKLQGRTAAFTVEPLGRLGRAALAPEIERIAKLKGAERVALELA